MRQEKSRVVIVPCVDYEEERVYEAVKKGVDLLGGLEAFVDKKEKVLLKPNLLNRAEEDKAVTTHPAVFGAVARLFRESGYDQLTYGDSPGHPGNVLKTAEICGIAPMAERYGIPLGEFGKSRAAKYERGRLTRTYEICEGVLDADAIVNICKMKTHQLERITGGVKNLFGCVCGLNKSASHAKYPDAHSFAQMLVELNLLLKPRLHIMDGIVAMEGNGPMSGEPVEMNVLLFSDDPVAMDATFCRMINLDPHEAPTVYYGEKLGLGVYHEEKIAILGVKSIKPLIRPDFDVERTGKTTGKWAFLRKLKFFIKRPVIRPGLCTRCGACVAACPVEGKAIRFGERGTAEPPVYNYYQCIRCYCCQEMCPAQAIVVKHRLG